MPRWRADAAPVERARELLRELDAEEAGEWSALAWNERGTMKADQQEASRAVAYDVERLRRSLRRFVAEDSRNADASARKRNASAFGDDVPAEKPDGCGLYPSADFD